MTEKVDTGERIAKVMARAGVASRRDAERLIVEGRVHVNGKPVTSPALDVLPTDRVTLDGKPIDAPQPARLWLYYKPLGLVTSEKDEKGRQTVFESLPDGMPRVLSVGRLDLNSEGLLLLTNDGGLKRRLELPSTGWLRKYRVRVNGRPNEATFDPLRRGITIEGEDFQPMEIHLDRQQGANAWLTVGIREGKNREIRRAMAEVGLTVNRLIRVSYGPFRLNEMQPGDVIEVKQKVLKEQLGDGKRSDRPDGDRPARPARPARNAAPRDGASGPEDRAERKPRRKDGPPGARPASDRPDRRPRSDAGGRPDARPEKWQKRDGEGGPKRPRSFGDNPDRPPRKSGPGSESGSFDRPKNRRPAASEGTDARPARWPKKDTDGAPKRPGIYGDKPDRGPRKSGPGADGGSFDRPKSRRPAASEGADARPARWPKKDTDGAPKRPRTFGDRPDRARDETGPRGAKPGAKPFGKPKPPRDRQDSDGKPARSWSSAPRGDKRPPSGSKPPRSSSGPGPSGPASKGPRKPRRP